MTVASSSREFKAAAKRDRTGGGVVVACPDARPPAYQAVVGLAEAGLLDRFLTSYYYRGENGISRLGRMFAPGVARKLERSLRRRQLAGIPVERVRPSAEVDLAIAIENRLGPWSEGMRGAVARWRTRRFDRTSAAQCRRAYPDAVLAFSDVGSEVLLPECRARGVRGVLSMVHGDVREERLLIERERERSPEFFGIYLAEGPIDEASLEWLHQRRLRDLEHAEMVLVPSDHIAGWLVRHGTPAERVRVIPYAADVERFRPSDREKGRKGCTFLFAGGITQRKGIGYLLKAWRQVRRPGWKLQLLGGMPADQAPLEPYREEVEWLGRVGHAEMPELMARADVFVFPSLFEGSAVVTYEAMACGLPSIATAASGTVARDGLEAILVPSAEVEPLAQAMERLGNDEPLRARMGAAARLRAEQYGWTRYHAAVVSVFADE